MLIQNKIVIDNKLYIETYSDKHCYIQGGFPEGLYDEAIDPIEENRQYIETDIPIEASDEEYIESAKILLGEEDVE